MSLEAGMENPSFVEEPIPGQLRAPISQRVLREATEITRTEQSFFWLSQMHWNWAPLGDASGRRCQSLVPHWKRSWKLEPFSFTPTIHLLANDFCGQRRALAAMDT